jgi:CheY-like chemotaxis protein
VLEHFGYEVLDAENGVRGLRVLEQNRDTIDLVILDMSMPKMDGEETLRRIRELGEQMPVVLTSGYTEVEISDRLGGSAASAFIGKPFSPKDLIQQVRRLL